jgi:hypothetical protein
MKALTHLAAGGASGAGLALVVGIPLGWETALLSGAAGAAMPELEYAFARLAREMRARGYGGPLLGGASALGQERGPWHGLEILAGVGALVGLLGWLVNPSAFLLAYVPFLGGWLSHLLLDLCNGGIRPLAILRPYRWAYFPPWGPRRLVRGGLFEGLVLLGAGWVWVWRLVERLLPLVEGWLWR